jgi:hypothetical protein
MSTLDEQIAALEAQIPKAGLEFQEGTRRTKYPPLAEILRGIDALKARQSQATGLGVAFFPLQAGGPR